MTPSLVTLADIISVWLEKQGRIGGKKFFIDNEDFDLIRCKECWCFEAFMESDHLMLRLQSPNYLKLRAVDPQFLPKLEKHLAGHICS